LRGNEWAIDDIVLGLTTEEEECENPKVPKNNAFVG